MSGDADRIRRVGFPDPDQRLFSSDPDPDSTCKKGYIKLLITCRTKYKPESTNSSIKWNIKSIFIPTYLIDKYIYIYIFHYELK